MEGFLRRAGHWADGGLEIRPTAWGVPPPNLAIIQRTQAFNSDTEASLLAGFDEISPNLTT